MSDKRFQVKLCPECERTTVVDTRYEDNRCDWSDTCGVLFQLGDALGTDVTMGDL